VHLGFEQMAIAPKNPRKRAAKKTPKVKAEVSQETTPAAASTESASVESASPDEKKTKPAKKAAVIPVAIFQAAPIAEKNGAEKAPAKKAPAKKSAPAKVAKSDEPVVEAEAKGESDSDSEDSSRGRRRRRGGRGRRKPGSANTDENSSTDENTEESETEDDGTGTHRRRRRRRAAGDGAVAGEVVEEDGVVTVVKVRETKERPTRNDPKRNRRERNDRPSSRGDREYRSDYREPYRRRGTIITDTDLLARRENVDREMLVRQIADRTQIAVIEDNVMVEHYVNRNTNLSYVGNIYLGRVQNVLPGMEAAFVDIGKGRNAVLYAGEVNWDAAGISESEPRKIETVLKSGQPVLVQVTKDPIGQKGARLTSQVSLPGRYVVYVPGGGMSGISKRLPEPERNRLKAILKNLIPETAGVIVRTAAEGVSEEDLTNDVARLKAQWEDIYQKSINPNFHAPAAIYVEPDLAVRVIRDIFNEDFRKLTVQGSGAWDEINNYLGFIAPELVSKIEKYTGFGDLFADFRVEEQLAKAFDRKVYLPSGGSLVIDRTEAMIVIDVNTGKFIGKGGSLEETVTKNNLEAAEEIARQLRLRDLGGIIVIDFIDMILESNREQVLRRLVECLGRDRTKHQVAEVTSLGLVQMTRKRVGQGLIEAFSTTCDSCAGRGIHIHMEPIKIKATPVPVAKEIETESGNDSNTDSDTESFEIEEPAGTQPPVEPAASGPRKKRRRAASSGIITPGSSPKE
jgi:Rne/Rng family ribonuclease